MLAKLDDQAERAVTALEQCQRQRDEMRAERDAAIDNAAALFASLAGIVDYFNGRFLPSGLAHDVRPLLKEAATIVAKQRISL